MDRLTWTEERFGTGFEEIDAQHRDFFERVNLLLDIEDAFDDALTPVLGFLRSYTVRHFVCEERLMERHGCGACGRNKIQHHVFVERFGSIFERWRSGCWSEADLRELQRFVYRWTEKHFSGVDTQLREVAPVGGVAI